MNEIGHEDNDIERVHESIKGCKDEEDKEILFTLSSTLIHSKRFYENLNELPANSQQVCYWGQFLDLLLFNKDKLNVLRGIFVFGLLFFLIYSKIN